MVTIPIEMVDWDGLLLFYPHEPNYQLLTIIHNTIVNPNLFSMYISYFNGLVILIPINTNINHTIIANHY